MKGIPKPMTMEELSKSLAGASEAMRDTCRTILECQDAILRLFTEAEIIEARDSGVPLLDYWAHWEGRGYKRKVEGTTHE